MNPPKSLPETRLGSHPGRASTLTSLPPASMGQHPLAATLPQSGQLPASAAHVRGGAIRDVGILCGGNTKGTTDTAQPKVCLAVHLELWDHSPRPQMHGGTQGCEDQAWSGQESGKWVLERFYESRVLRQACTPPQGGAHTAPLQQDKPTELMPGSLSWEARLHGKLAKNTSIQRASPALLGGSGLWPWSSSPNPQAYQQEPQSTGEWYQPVTWSGPGSHLNS